MSNSPAWSKNALIALALIACPSVHGFEMRAADISAVWDGAVADWSDSSHWSSDPLVPNNGASTFDVVISEGTVNQDIVEGVQIHDFAFRGGTLAGDGAVSVLGEGTWGGGTLSNVAGLTISSGATLDLSGPDSKNFGDNARLNIEGVATINGSGKLVTSADVASPAVVNILPGGTLKLIEGGRFSSILSSTGTINNAGIFLKSGGENSASVGTQWSVVNTGTIEVQGGTLTLGGSVFRPAVFANSGTVNVLSGKLTIASKSENSGIFNVSAGALLRFSSVGSHLLDGATIRNEGSVRLSGVIVESPLTLGGIVDVSNATFNAPSTITGHATLESFGLWGTQQLSISDFTWLGGSLANRGGVSIPSDGTLVISGDAPKTIRGGAALNLAGRATVTGDGNISLFGVSQIPALISILPNAVFDLQTDVDFESRPDNFTTVINNGGTFTKTAGTGLSQVDREFTFNNSGAIMAQSGTLAFQTLNNNGLARVESGSVLRIFSGESAGVFEVAPSGTLEFVTQFQSLNGASVVNAGVVEVSGLTVAAPLTLPGTVNLVGSFVANAPTRFSGPVALAADPFAVGSTLLGVRGTGRTTFVDLTWASGSLSDVGGVTIEESGILKVTGTRPKSVSNGGILDVAGSMIVTNDASISSKNSIAFGPPSSLFVQETGVLDLRGDAHLTDETSGRFLGNLHNRGTFLKSAGAGVSRIAWNLVNAGVVEVRAGEMEFGALFRQTSGMLSLAGGNLAIIGPGSFQIEGGRVTGAGTIRGDLQNFGGTIVPGASSDNPPGSLAGILSLRGNFQQEGAGWLQMNIDGMIPGTEYDQFNVTGVAALHGGLNIVVNANGGSYRDPSSRGDSHTLVLMTVGSRSGTFGSVRYDDATLSVDFTDGDSFRSHQGNGLFRNILYTETTVEVTNYFAVGGDADGDTSVSASADGSLLLASLGTGTGKEWTDGDFTGEGEVTASEDGRVLLRALSPDGTATGTVRSYYNPVTGYMTVESTGVARVSILSRSGHDILVPDAAAFVGDFQMAAVDNPGQQDLTWITLADTIGTVPGSRTEGGLIILPGTPVSAILVEVQLVGQEPFGGRVFVVPEPTAQTLSLMVGGFSILACFFKRWPGVSQTTPRVCRWQAHSADAVGRQLPRLLF